MFNMIDNYLNILKENNQKVTLQRIKILEIFLNNPNKHFTPEQIEEILKSKNEVLGIATVYRNLKIFEKLELIKGIVFCRGGKKYELNRREEYEEIVHTHLICKECKKIIDYNSRLEIEDIVRKEDYKSLNVQNIDINIYGICKECK